MPVDVTLALLAADSWTPEEEQAIQVSFDNSQAARAVAAARVRQSLVVTEPDRYDRCATVILDGEVLGTVAYRPLYDFSNPWQANLPSGPLMLAGTAMDVARMLAVNVLVARGVDWCFVCGHPAHEPVALNLCGRCLGILTRHCFSKLRNPSAERAEGHKTALLARRGVELRRYSCGICAGHHVTSGKKTRPGGHLRPIVSAMAALGFDGQDLRSRYLFEMIGSPQ